MRVAVKQVLAASGPFGMVQAAAAADQSGGGSDRDKEMMETFAQVRLCGVWSLGTRACGWSECRPP